MQYQSIRVVRPDQLDSGTAQTPGSQRFAAIPAERALNRPCGEGYFWLNLEPALGSITMESNTQSPMFLAALLTFDGASGESST